MPNSNKKVLTLMWQEGNILRTYRSYRKMKEDFSYTKGIKRVWVGLDKGLAQSNVLSADSLEGWIFTDLTDAYREVKDFNLQKTN